MALLSLPSEILHEILSYASQITSVGQLSQRYPNTEIINVAATCRLLRSLALKIIYSKIVVKHYSKISKLHNYLTECSYIAAYIHELSLLPEQNKKLGVCREILKNCTGLRHLELREYDSTDSITMASQEQALHHLHPESKRSLKSLGLLMSLPDLLENFKFLSSESNEGYFSALREISVCRMYTGYNLEDPEYLLEPGFKKIESVRTLKFSLHYSEDEFPHPLLTLQSFVLVMPNVESLHLKIPPQHIDNFLTTYIELGHNITELRLGGVGYVYRDGTRDGCTYRWRDHPHHLCKIIPKLSQNLKRFSIETTPYIEYRFCHLLFGKATDWVQLVDLDVSCQHGCTGVKPDLLHTAVTELSQAHPQASLRLAYSSPKSGLTELVRWNLGGQKYIAPPAMFTELVPPPPPHLIEELFDEPGFDFYDVDDDDYDDYDHDYEHDIEDAIESYFEDDDEY